MTLRPGPRVRTTAAASWSNISSERVSSSASWSAEDSIVWLSSASAVASWCEALTSAARRALAWTTSETAAPMTTKSTSATTFCGSEIVSVPMGGVKNQLMSRDDSTPAVIAGAIPPMSATTTVSSRYSCTMSGSPTPERSGTSRALSSAGAVTEVRKPSRTRRVDNPSRSVGDEPTCASSWVTTWTSMSSPEPAMMRSPVPGRSIAWARERRLRPTTIWSALTPRA